MTRIAIIAAMPGELKPLTLGWRHESRKGIDLWFWRYDHRAWIAVCAGAGVDAATRAFAEAEKTGPVSSVISVGWAGALSDEFATGRAYWVSGVIDARTGERFETAGSQWLSEESPSSQNRELGQAVLGLAKEPDALKGHGFSRAAEAPSTDAALAAEKLPTGRRSFPHGLKPALILSYLSARLKSCPFKTMRFSADCKATPFQDSCWLVTTPRVADVAGKQRLATAYHAGLVDMEAAAIARLAQTRGIPFYCLKGISDGYRDRLPDFNPFITEDGQFMLTRFVVFVLLRPWYWPALMRMGENSKSASRSISDSLLEFFDERGPMRDRIRERNGNPNDGR